jgi:hypothetical protein
MSKLFPSSRASKADRLNRNGWISGLALSTALAANSILIASVNAQAAPPPPPPPPPPIAQAFQGTFNAVGGSASFATAAVTGGRQDTITVNQPTAVINWTPTDNIASPAAINFLASGDSAVFQGGPSASNFTVLNRIIPVGAAAGRRISLNGSVSSIGSGNGNIWFYTPNGFLIGASARFNVNGLTISTLDHPYNTSTGALTFTGTGASQWGLTAPTIAGSSIEVANGAQFNLTNNGSYLALISPRIVQGGSADVNGGVAYVAAESATISLAGGLFDIDITQGTSDANGIVHTGTTTGAAQLSSFTPQAIAMVAIPKNDALTMLVGGTVGYQPASSAIIQNGSVILSAGVDRARLANGAGQSTVTEGNALANIRLTGGTFTSSVDALATGTAEISLTNANLNLPGYDLPNPFGSDLIKIAHDLKLFGKSGVSVAVGSASSINTGGKLTLDSQRLDATAADGTAGNVTLTIANGGQVNADTLELVASSRGSISTTSGASATGGAVNISVSGAGSSLTTANTRISADASGGANIDNSATTGGNGTAGAISIQVAGGGAVSLGDTSISSRGTGYLSPELIGTVQPGDVNLIPGQPRLVGGSGTGGSLTVTTSGLSRFSASSIDVDVSGQGGVGTQQGGAGQGGAITFQANGGRIALGTAATPVDTVVFTANGNGSTGIGRPSTPGDGSNGIAGSISIIANLGEIDLSADGATITANAAAGLASDGSAGFSRGGNILIESRAAPLGSPTVSTMSLGNLSVSTLANNVFDDGESTFGDGAGGAATGGSITINALGGTISATSIDLLSQAIAGTSIDSRLAGQGTGGSIGVNLSGGNLTVIGRLGARSLGVGGYAEQAGNRLFNGLPEGQPGNGIGGAVNVSVQAGTLDVGTLELSSNGTGGRQAFDVAIPSTISKGGTGRGGTSSLTVSGTGQFVANIVNMSSTGIGGDRGPGGPNGTEGGDGFGGTTSFTINGGSADVNRLSLSASGSGASGRAATFGTGGAPLGGDGGSGSGGTTSFQFNSGTMLIDFLSLGSVGRGGAGATSSGNVITVTGGDGGDAQSGTALLKIGADPTVTDLTIDVSAFGGSGGNGTVGGNGGNIITNPALTEATLNLTSDTLNVTGLLSISANAVGGSGGNGTSGAGGIGGNATALDILVVLNGATTVLNANTANLNADAFGGNGGSGFGQSTSGGNATAGAIRVLATGGSTLNIANSFNISALAQGGDARGINDAISTSIGGAGGNAVAGTITVGSQTATDGTITVKTLDLNLSATGGNGADVTNFSSPAGTGGNGGNATNGSFSVAANLSSIGPATSYSINQSAVAGSGGSGQVGGNGGNALAGAASILRLRGATSAPLSSISINSRSDAGAGGDGEVRGGSGGAARGASAELIADGTALTVNSTITMNSSAVGGTVGTSNAITGTGATAASGGSATAGSLGIFTQNGGTITNGDSMQLTATATGRSGANGLGGATQDNGGAGGSATGGLITVGARAGGGRISNNGSIRANASAASGDGGNGGLALVQTDTTSLGGNAGSATGGNISIDVTGVNNTDAELVLNSSAVVGNGGDGGTGGNSALATAGNATLRLTGSNVGDLIQINTRAGDFGSVGTGGSGRTGNGGAGSSAIAGTATLLVEGTGAAATFGSLSLETFSAGGRGGSGRPAGAGGTASGGQAIVNVDSNGATPASLIINGNTSIDAGASGGAGGLGINGDNEAALVDGANGGAGGQANGGTASINLTGFGGTLSINTLNSLSAGASGGSGGSGGDGFNDSTGGAGGNGGLGGVAVGGTASITQDSGTLTIVNGVTAGAPATVSANSFGGNGGNFGLGTEGNDDGLAARAGQATGGTASVETNSGTMNTPGLLVTANGTGGNGFGLQGGQGGGGTGGSASLIVGSNFNSSNVTTQAIGLGGSSGQASGTIGVGANGAVGQGGEASFRFSSSDATLNVAGLFLIATGTGSGGGNGDALTGQGGTGGTGIGGTAELDIGQATSFSDVLIDTSGRGGTGGSGATGGQGGSAFGGGQQSGNGIRLIIGSNITAVTDLQITNGATGGAGGIGLNGSGGDGGEAIGGNFNLFSSNGGRLEFTQNTIDVSAVGGAGGSAANGSAGTQTGGTGGTGRGGNILAQASNGSTLILDAGQGIISTGRGGAGGSGNRSSDSDSGAGGVGGAGHGGTVSVVGETGGTVNATAFSANVSGFGGVGGAGGAGRQGTNAPITAAANGTNGTNGTNGANAAALGAPGLPGTNGTSGTNGTNGLSGGNGGNGGVGGAGGTGSGGAVTFSASTDSEIDAGNLSITAAGFGGAGGIGGVGGLGGNGQTGGAGGNGGIGGSGGTGGPGANFGPGPVPAGAGGAAGNGGNGGNGGFGGAGGFGGNGGDAGRGGTGIGGTVSLIAVDSTITTGTLTLSTNGSGGDFGTAGLGGLGGTNADGGIGGTAGAAGARGPGGTFVGPGPNGPLGAAGTNGISGISRNFGTSTNFSGFDGNVSLPSEGAGGLVLLRVESGTFGIGGTINAGAVTSNATGLATGGVDVGGAAGTIQLQNRNFFPGSPTITLDSLTSRALGTGGPSAAGGIEIEANFNPIIINGQVDLLTTQSINISAVGAGKLVSTGPFSAQADGFVTIRHDQKPEGANTIEAPSVFVRGDLGISAEQDATLRSTSSLNLQSLFGTISANELFSVDSILAEAGNSIFLRNATTTGTVTPVTAGSPLGGTITLRAGVDPNSPSDYFFGSASVTGDVTSTGTVSILAAQAANIQGTANIRSNNDIIIRTGEDVTISDGVQIRSALSPIGGGASSGITLDAGGLLVDFQALDDQATLRIGEALISAADSNIFLRAGKTNSFQTVEGMIDAFNGSFTSQNFDADVLSFGGKSIGVGGRTSPVQCVVGGVCVANISATNLSLGGSAGLVAFKIPGGNSIFETISIGSQGEVRLIGEDFAQSQLTGTRDISINAGGSLIFDAGLIDLPDFGADPERFGDVILSGGEENFEITAASLTSLLSNDTDGAPDTGAALSAPNALNSDRSRSIGGIDASGNLGLSVGDIDFGSISAGGAIGSSTVVSFVPASPLTFGSITVDTLSTSGEINIAANTIAIGNANAGDGTNLTLNATNSVILNGTGSANGQIRDVDLAAGGFISAQGISNFGNLTADAGSVDISFSSIGGDIFATGSSVSMFGVNAGGSVDVDAIFDATLGGVSAGSNLDVSGSEVTINSSSGGSVNATGGNITVQGVTSFGDLILNGSGNVTSGGFAGLLDLTASGRVDIEAGGTVQVGNIRSNSGDIDISAGGAITTSDITASSGSASLSNGFSSITTGIVAVSDDFTLNTDSNLNLAGVTAGDDIQITTTSGGTFGRLIANGGGADAESNGSNINLNVSGQLFVDHAEAGGDFSATADRFETGPNTIITGGNIDLNIAGDIILGNSQAGGFLRAISTNSGAITFGTMTANDFATLITGGNVTGGQITANGGIGIGGGTININSLISRGTFVPPVGIPPLEAAVLVLGSGDVTLNNAASPGMLGVVSGGVISSNGTWTAGEDILGFSANRISINNATAGDDLSLIAPNDIVINNGATTGAGPDGRNLVFGANGFAFTPDTSGENSDILLLTIAPPQFVLGVSDSLFVTAVAPSNGLGSGNITAGNLTAASDVRGITNGSIAVTGLARTLGLGTAGSTSGIGLGASSVTVAQSDAALDIVALSTGTIDLGNANAGRSIFSNTTGNTIFGSVSTDTGNITILSTGTTTGGTLDAGANLSLNASSISVGDGTAIGTVDYVANSGDIESGDISGSGVTLTANSGSLTTGSIVARSTNVNLSALGAITTGDITANNGSAFISNSTGAITTGLITVANDFTLFTNNQLNLGGVSAGDDIRIATAADANLGSLTARGTGTDNESDGSNIFVNVDGAVTINNANAATMIGVRGATVSGNGTWSAGEDLLVISAGSTNLGALSAGDNLTIQGAGPISVLSATSTGLGRDDRTLSFGSPPSASVPLPPTFLINASTPNGGDVSISSSAGGTISAGGLTAADDITLQTTGDISVTGLARTNGTGTTGGSSNITASGANVSFGSTNAATSLTVAAIGNAALGASQAGGTINSTAGGTTDFTSLQSGGPTFVQSGNQITGDSISAGGIAFVSSDNGIAINSISAGAFADISVDDGALSLGTITATGDVRLRNFGTGPIAVTAGGLAGGNFTASGNGPVSIARATANGTFVDPATGIQREGNVFVTTTGPVSVGGVTARSLVGITGSAVTGTDTITAGEDIFIRSDNGAISLASVSAGDDLTIRATGGSIAVASATARGTGPDARSLGFQALPVPSFNDEGGGTDGANLTLSATGGGISAGSATAAQSASLTASGAITGGNVTATAGNVTIDGASANLGLLTAGNNVTGTATGLFQTTGGTAGRSYTVTAGQTSLGRINADEIVINSTQGVIFERLIATDNVILTAGNDIIGELITAADTARLNAGRRIRLSILRSGAFSSTAVTTTQIEGVIVARDAVLASPGGILIGSTEVGGTLGLTAVAGDVNVTNNLVVAGLVNATGQNIDLRGPGNVTFDALNATNALSVQLAGVFGLNGIASGQTIAIASADVVIAPAARIGAQGVTTSATLTNIGNRQTYIGGTGGTGTYSLSNAEAQRIFANNISVVVPIPTNNFDSSGAKKSAALNTNPPSVILDALTLTGANGQTGATAGNIGTNGTFTIQTPGKLSTIGAVTLTNFTNNNRFNVNAAEAIEVDQRTGSISLRDASGGLAGTIGLTSQDVFAGTPSALTDVIAAPDVKTINDRLTRNDSGVVSDMGSFSANGLVVDVQNGFYIQNTGTTPSSPRLGFDQRRGFTVGAGGLQVTLGGPSARIVISGRQVDPAGGFVTGLRTIPLVSFGGRTTGLSGLFDPGSTLNGCAILTPALCSVNFEQIGITRDTINRNGDPDAVGLGMPLPFGLIQLKDVEALGYEPIIDDPVTGAGNDDLWSVDDEQEEATPPAE